MTEYAEQSAEHQRAMFPQMLFPRLEPRAEYPIAMNPFQSPGQRGIPMYKMPNAINGFTPTVVKNDSAVKKKVKASKEKAATPKAEPTSLIEKLASMGIDVD